MAGWPRAIELAMSEEEIGALAAIARSRSEPAKPHKVRDYLERRDDEFEQKMAEVLCVYREVQVLKSARKSKRSGKSVAITLTNKNQESRRSQRQRSTCRHSPAFARPLHVTTMVARRLIVSTRHSANSPIRSSSQRPLSYLTSVLGLSQIRRLL